MTNNDITSSATTPEDELHGAPSKVTCKPILFSDLKTMSESVVRKMEMRTKGIMFMPNSGRFPSSRDWNMPAIKCDATKCAANYHKECVMPSLIGVDAKGKCKGFHPRKMGKKK